MSQPTCSPKTESSPNEPPNIFPSDQPNRDAQPDPDISDHELRRQTVRNQAPDPANSLQEVVIDFLAGLGTIGFIIAWILFWNSILP